MHFPRSLVLLITLAAAALAAAIPAARAQETPRAVSPQVCLDTGVACLAYCAQQQGIAYDGSRREVCEASCKRQYAECRDTGASRVDAGRAAYEANAAEPPPAESREAKKALRKDFVARYGVESWTTDQALAANPYGLKGKVVAIPTRFSWAPAEDEAIFANSAEFLVSGVKPEQFQGKGYVVLAVRVLGVKSIRFNDGDALVAHTELVGVYECTRGCKEFFD